MKKNLPNKGVLTENSADIGPVTPTMVAARARMLAAFAGRDPAHSSPADRKEAGRELTGATESAPPEEKPVSVPESERWDPLPGSVGHQAPESADEDEDAEGRSETEQLFDQGVAKAERDRMHQAAKAAEKTDGPRA